MKNYLKNNTFKTVVAIGKFDGIHIGHRKLIETAVSISKEKKLKSLVYVICPEKCGSIVNEVRKKDILEEMGVDFYFKQNLTPEFMSITPRDFVRKILDGELLCSHVTVGYDFRFGSGRSAGVEELKKLCDERAIDVTVIDEVRLKGADEKERTVSSTLIRKFISTGDFKNVSLYLGEKFSICGTVSHGRQLGRTIGFPTANLIPADDMPKIASGVYATVSRIGDDEYLGITNIGTNPTVKAGNPVTVETNVFNFSGDLYGKEMEVFFLKKIRDEEKFPSISALKNQIQLDKNYVIKKYGK